MQIANVTCDLLYGDITARNGGMRMKVECIDIFPACGNAASHNMPDNEQLACSVISDGRLLLRGGDYE